MTWIRKRKANGRFARKKSKVKRTEKARSPQTSTIKRNYKLAPKKAKKGRKRKGRKK